MKSFSQENDKVIYDKTITYFADSILKKNKIDRKLIVFFNGKTSKSISYLLPYTQKCFTAIDTVLFFKENEKELDSNFWKKNEKEAIEVKLPKGIKRGEIRGLFCNQRKRQMTLYQVREIGNYKFVTIELSNKNNVFGENYSILVNSKNEVIDYCFSSWVR
jgi:hypothetical protein